MTISNSYGAVISPRTNRHPRAPRHVEPTECSPEEASLLQANLERVFGERDGARRLAAIQALYVEDATLFEPHASATGHASINQAVEC